MLFLFHKFTGTDSLNYYAPRIFELIGVGGGSSSLLTTVCFGHNLSPALDLPLIDVQGVYGVVKVVTTIFYVGFLVE